MPYLKKEKKKGINNKSRGNKINSEIQGGKTFLMCSNQASINHVLHPTGEGYFRH
jgi:hypothetical protein